ncbi:MAG TPA: CPBP family intramembrane glutamic endopeptidase [Candidatus Acidoferrales bacterium]|nr:CPBP family intramembrane glutamic endopeptidase [Candidatus Acidoferrales bacterium]
MIWRFVGFFLLVTALSYASEFVVEPLARLLHVDVSTLNSGSLLLEEVVAAAGVILVTWIFAKIERQRVDAYGLPVRLAFRARFWEGAALGIVTAGAVAAGMYALGGFVIHGFALHGSDWIVQPLLWGLAMIFVGIEEEMWFRGYGLQALARGIGFWPAAAVTSLIFGGLHLTKSGENFIDIFNIIALGFLMAITVWRTGSLWLAVGFHFTFDFMQFFVIGTRNGGATPVGTLLSASFPGAAWVNGGALGTEASYLMLPAIALLYVYVLWRYPKNTTLASP